MRCDALVNNQKSINANLLGKTNPPQFTFVIMFVMKINHWQLLEKQIKAAMSRYNQRDWWSPLGKSAFRKVLLAWHVWGMHRIFPKFLGLNDYWLGQSWGIRTAAVAFSAC